MESTQVWKYFKDMQIISFWNEAINMVDKIPF